MLGLAAKILIPGMETILVISCFVLLATGLPAPGQLDHQQEVKEIKLGEGVEFPTQRIDCSSKEKIQNDTRCQSMKMQQFGYLTPPPEGGSSIITEEEMRSAIIDFQVNYKIPQTGVMDDLTAEYVAAHFCSVPDKDAHQRDTKRKKRYALNGSKWASNDLTWCIYDSDLTPDLSKEEQKRAIDEAFQMWADSSRLTFTEVTDCRRAVIQIKFATGAHGDNDPFDGPHGTLAHAYFPRFGGDAHFDDDEQWSLSSTSRGRKLLLPIATHEFGHSLGLGHSRDQTAIMYALYFGSNPVVKLQPDDINGIQFLYGPPDTRPPTQPPPPTPGSPTAPPATPPPATPAPTRGPVTALCTDVPDLDAIVMLGNGFTFAFSGEHYWRMNSNRAIDLIPLPIGQNWYYIENNQVVPMPGNFDAVLFWPTENCTPRCRGNTFFFSGSYVYVQRGRQGTNGQVEKRLIRNVFPGLPDNIDAATLWTGNNKAYFFKGNQYYRVSSNVEPHRVDDVNWPYGYPRPIDQYWELGWPSIDSAIYYWHYSRPDIKKTYFFKGNQYVRYNDVNGGIDNNYPKMTEINWYGCNSNGFIQDGDDMQGNDMTEMEMFDDVDTDMMDIEEIDIRTAMELPPEDASSANAVSSAMTSLVLVFLYCVSLILL